MKRKIDLVEEEHESEHEESEVSGDESEDEEPITFLFKDYDLNIF